MGDFARWVVAAEPLLPWAAGTFMKVYKANRREATVVTLEASPVGQALVAFMEGRASWTGTATELLEMLRAKPDLDMQSSKSWPRGGKGMSDALRRLLPSLRVVGIEVGHCHHRHGGRDATARLRFRRDGPSEKCHIIVTLLSEGRDHLAVASS